MQIYMPGSEIGVLQPWPFDNPGFGLGLTIVDTIAAQHEGSLTFEQGAQGLEVRFTIQR